MHSTDAAYRYRCFDIPWSVCVLLYVGHDREFYKSGCTDRDVLSAAVRTHEGPTEPRSGRGSDPPQERHFGACYRM